MFKRLKTTSLAGGGALLLVLSLSGVVAGASFLAATGPTQETVDPEVVVDTTATFEDTNGNGIDDDCEEAEVADPVAEAAAEAAVDTDGNGVISVSEAAHSDRIGGKNCNHGGYVSGVAHGDEACEEAETTDPVTTDPTVTEARVEVTEPDVDEPVVEAPVACDAATDDDAADTDGAADETAAIAAAKAAAKEARAAAKEARKAERDAAKAERDAAKAERKAAHEAKKAERAAERAAAKAERAAKPAKVKTKNH